MIKRNILVVLAAVFCLHADAQAVKTGIEVLKESGFKALEGKRVGLITNPTGVDSQLVSTIDLFYKAENVNLVALFAPEHGVRGDIYAGAHVDSNIDIKTGLPVHSLYGKTSKPTPAMLEGIDLLVYDIQDIGCRSYTFISTMGLAMEAAAENNIEFMVLDRPNPLGGLKIEGNYVEEGYYSFVSRFRIPYIYGQTCGELALMLNEENYLKKKCKLTVIAMEGWKRNMAWEETGLPWVMTSPHIPQKQSTYFYPMTGIMGELDFVSIGVGYTLPFELVGAPWIKAQELAEALNGLQLPGLEFRPIFYKPYYAKFKGEVCEGVQIHITDYDVAGLSIVQFYVMQELYKLYPDKAAFAIGDKKRFGMFDKVCGTDKIRTAFEKNYRVADMEEVWNRDIEHYRSVSQPYYLY